MLQANMAARKVSIRQLPFLNPSICWNVSQRNFGKQRAILKKMGLPEKPKKPLNGYLSYTAAFRPTLQAQNPNMSFTEVSKLLGKNWRELPESEKKKYELQFQEKLKRYNEEMKEYNESLTESQKCEINELMMGYKAAQKEKSILNDVKKLEKELKKPKKPESTYMMFCNKYLESWKGEPLTRKELGNKWRELSEKEKETFRTMYNKENEQYKKNLEKWEEEMIQQGKVDLIRVKTLKEKVQKYV